MSISRQEEIIAALWTICFLICVVNNFTAGVWVFGFKAISDIFFSIQHAIKELKAGETD